VSESSAHENEFRRGFQPRRGRLIPRDSWNPQWIEQLGGHQIDDLWQEPSRIRARNVEGHSSRVHLEQGHRGTRTEVDGHARAVPVVLSRPEHGGQPFGISGAIDGDQGSIEAAGPAAVMLDDVRPQGLRSGQRARITVDIANPPSSQGQSCRHRVQGDGLDHAAHDEHLSVWSLSQKWPNRSVSVGDVIGQGRERRHGHRGGRRQEEMVCGGHGEEVGHGAPETATGLAESEGSADSSAIRGAAAKASVLTRRTGSARHLERHQDSITTAMLSNLLADGHDLCDGFVTESKRPGEEPGGRHGKVEIAPCHRERPHHCASRIGRDGVRLLSPLDATCFDERQLAHEDQSSAALKPGRISRSGLNVAEPSHILCILPTRGRDPKNSPGGPTRKCEGLASDFLSSRLASSRFEQLDGVTGRIL